MIFFLIIIVGIFIINFVFFIFVNRMKIKILVDVEDFFSESFIESEEEEEVVERRSEINVDFSFEYW